MTGGSAGATISTEEPVLPPNHGGSVLSALRDARWVGVCLGLAVAITGCAGGSKNGGARGASADAQQPAAQPGRLSYGTVTSTVKKKTYATPFPMIRRTLPCFCACAEK